MDIIRLKLYSLDKHLMQLTDNMDLFEEINARGFVKDMTHPNILRDKLGSGESISFYLGIDCTGRSLHIGHLVPLMLARLLGRHGHKPILLIGDATSKIGDPSEKAQTRKMITDEEIIHNEEGIVRSLGKLFDLDNAHNSGSARLVRNSQWFKDMKYIDFLTEVGRHFSVNHMISMETAKARLQSQSNLNFVEFNYSLLQSYDFVKLNDLHGTTLQIGGADQWGNVVAGVELGHKMAVSDQLMGLTVNYLVNADGKKMGKTVDGAIWINEDMLTAFDLWQYFRNVDDRDVKKLLFLLSELDIDEIRKVAELDINDQKVALANAVVTVIHGKNVSQQCMAKAQALFCGKGEMEPDIVITRSNEGAMDLIALIRKLNAADSNASAKRLISQKAIRIGDTVIDDIGHKILYGEDFVLKVGKSKKFFVKIQN